MLKGLLVATAISLMLVACQACVGNLSYVRESMEIDGIERLAESTVRIDMSFAAAARSEDRLMVYEGGRIGTGVVLAHRKGETLILTAGHVCAVPRSVHKGQLELRTMHSSFSVLNSGGTLRLVASPVRQDMTNDLCLMTASGKIGRTIEIGGLPRRHSKVMVVGGPIGLLGDGVAYVGEGRYIGTKVERGKSMSFLSVAMASGGSGSGVYHRGKLVGIVIAVGSKFNHGTVFVPISVVKRFVEGK